MRHLLATALLTLTACSTAQQQPPGPVGPAPALSGIKLTPAQAQKIGQKIWQNECSGTVDGLTTWNDGEDFASLGIGHFIWYPPGKNGPFTESFPQLVRYLQARRVPVPAWVARTPDCPWSTKAAFQRDFRSPRMNELRAFLQKTVPQQTGFIVQRLELALPKMLAAAPATDRARIRRNFYATAESSNGVYALIDYVNFKGEGINPAERYHGQGWGLLQVLQGMRGNPSGPAAAREFSASAARTLSRRVANAPAARNESRWIKGWHNRCASYARPF